MKREPIHTGIIVGLLILAVALLIGGLYLWGGLMARQGVSEVPGAHEAAPQSADLHASVELGSHEIPAIEEDLRSVDLDITEEIEAIERAL